MNLYIFFTATFLTVGGMQQYVRGKADSLKKMGWDIVVFSPQRCIGTGVYSDLNSYICAGNMAFNYPVDYFNEQEREKIYETSIKTISLNPKQYEKICIESHYETVAFWAEYFAQKMGAKHSFCAINELFRGENKLYEKYMDFFKFKLSRHEISGRVKQLFEGYIDINDLPEYESWVIEKNPIEDVDSTVVDVIKKADYTIAIISRGEKEYIPGAFEAIRNFCIQYLNKEFQIVLVGDYFCRFELIGTLFLSLPNVKIYSTGNLVPIPKKLYEKVDIVLANSATAMFSAYQGIPVMVLCHEYGLSNGILGYDCQFEESIYLKSGKPNKKISDLLEEVLIKKEYKNKKPSIPEEVNEIDFHRKKLDYLNYNIPSSKTDYYQFPNISSIKDVRHDLYSLSKKYEYKFVEAKDLNNKTFIVFGAGNEGEDCVRWLNSIGKTVLFIIDNDKQKENKRIEDVLVLSPEQIKNVKEDYYVIIANYDYYEEIEKQLINDLSVEKKVCIPYRYLREWPFIAAFYDIDSE